ncbi:hypothetical protein K227x_50310 [Rubripirellula lacrimiformis]|uniref:Transposase DDE domain protein n=1 Tax=Rubripirellula lacrimiformis TaxID=1930273 RepID=A0A517NHL2_9BACT|nr:IS4 family transposase [Rubripirellula lacrimiformis]QDT06620.1 hypothetical protein K227x_50310 [Rubripirellula lacrimiformis]
MKELGVFCGSEQAKFTSQTVSERIRCLKRIISKRKVNAIIGKDNPDRRKCSKCPATMMVWFTIALGLFGDDSYRQVFKSLHRFAKNATPTRSALTLARAKLGIPVLAEVYRSVVKCLCNETTRGAFYRGLRLVAVDGFVLDLPDSEANCRAFGKPKNGSSLGAFPQLRIVALCEVGSHVFFEFLAKPIRCGEVTLAKHVYRSLPAGSLLTFDIGFFATELVKIVLERKSHFLGRAKVSRILKPIETLRDGSYLAKIYDTDYERIHDRNGTTIRVIEYTLDDPQRVGHNEVHRLVTSMLDPLEHPATVLIELYHERWEEEIAIDEIKTHARTAATLRSQSPAGVIQEVYGLLTAHFVVRKTMFDAASQATVAPRRISFTGALKILRVRLPEAPRSDRGIKQWHDNLIAEISEEVLPERRNRINPRVIKKTQSKWPKARPEHRKLPKLEKKFPDAVKVLI